MILFYGTPKGFWVGFKYMKGRMWLLAEEAVRRSPVKSSGGIILKKHE